MNHYILQALTLDGKSAYIEDVPNGKNCGCVCAECKGALVAKNKGTIKIHHFAHASGNDSIKCSQTALHLLAKQIVMEEKRIPAFREGKIEFVQVNTVEAEKNLGDIIPDLYAEYEGKPIAIEIFVSHAVDEKKFAKIQSHKLTTFEINLSALLFETKDEVRKAIFDIKNIRPIYDEDFTEKAIADKKQFIDKNGINKPVIGGIVRDCPMNIKLHGRNAYLDSIQQSVCELCPFGYKKSDANCVHCVGHQRQFVDFSMRLFQTRLINPNITITTDYWWQLNISKNMVVSLSELAEFFTLLTKQKFTVIKQKKQRQ